MKSCFRALGISILTALPLVAQENPDDPFGPEEKPGKVEKVRDYDGVHATAKRIFGDDFITLRREFAEDGKDKVILSFRASETDPKELQDLFLRAATVYMRRTKVATSEIIMTAKSRHDIKNPEDDPTDYIRVSLNAPAAKEAKWQSPKGLEFAKLFNVTWINADYKKKSGDAWPEVKP